MKKGITLIEILVTSLILAMGIATMMYSFVICKRIIIRNTHKNNATLIMNEQFEEIQRRQTSFDLTDYLNAKGLIAGINIQKSYYTGGNYLPQNYFVTIRPTSVVNTANGFDLSLITATVTWGTSQRDRHTMFIFSNEPI
jgi:type II secretory pathway pseudopilin PulG